MGDFFVIDGYYRPTGILHSRHFAERRSEPPPLTISPPSRVLLFTQVSITTYVSLICIWCMNIVAGKIFVRFVQVLNTMLNFMQTQIDNIYPWRCLYKCPHFHHGPTQHTNIHRLVIEFYYVNVFYHSPHSLIAIFCSGSIPMHSLFNLLANHRINSYGNMHTIRVPQNLEYNVIHFEMAFPVKLLNAASPITLDLLRQRM